MQNKHLIKRATNLTDDGYIDNEKVEGWIVDIAKGGKPSGTDNIVKGDTIYCAESGYAIYGKAIVKEKVSKYVTGIDGLLEHFFEKSRATNVDTFFYSKLKEYYKKSDNKTKFGIREILLDQGEVFRIPYILEDPFLIRQSYFKLEEDFNLKNTPLFNKNLTDKIPPYLRKEVFRKYNIAATEFYIDIDHHVPIHVGGPGTIIENLIPTGANYNRAKSKEVPSFLFQYAKEKNLGIKIPVPILKLVKPNYYAKDKESINLATKIVKIINEDYDTALEAYHAIKVFHFPILNNIK